MQFFTADLPLFIVHSLPGTALPRSIKLYGSMIRPRRSARRCVVEQNLKTHVHILLDRRDVADYGYPNASENHVEGPGDDPPGTAGKSVAHAGVRSGLCRGTGQPPFPQKARGFEQAPPNRRSIARAGECDDDDRQDLETHPRELSLDLWPSSAIPVCSSTSSQRIRPGSPGRQRRLNSLRTPAP